MASGFIDSLKLVLSDNYEISDSDYKALSDILLEAGLSDRAFDSGLVQLIHLMIRYNHRYPISLTFLKELWEYENISYNFVKMLGDLLREGVISLRKVKRETFFKSDNITKSNTEELDKDIYIVIYGSQKFNSVFSKFNDILNKRSSSLHEGAGLPKKYQDLVDKTIKLLKNISILVSVESFTSDSALGVASLSMILSQTSKYKYKDKDIQRIASKWIKGREIKSVESYKESNSELFLGLDLINSESSFLRLADSIYSFMEELEVQGV